jgi:hypothetical protein
MADRRSIPWLWIARALWLAVAVSLTLAAGEAGDHRSAAVRLVAVIGACLLWAVVLVGLIVPSTASLTTVRLVAPLAVVAAAVAAAASEWSVAGLAAVAVAAAAAVLLLSGDVGRVMVQASAYGDEQRHLLRPPAAVVPPIVLAWIVWAAAIVAGPLLVAAANLLAGIVLCVAAASGGWLLVPRFHGLARRWLVTLSTGLVVHDPLLLAETVMVPRRGVRSMRLALAGTQALDLTGPSAGHAVEVRVDPPVTITLRSPGRRATTRAVHATAFLVAPTRPGDALRASADHRLPIG